MKEYIERGKLMEYPIRLDHYDKENGNENFVLGIESVLEYAEALPAADVVERKRGEWEVHPQDTFAREHHCEKLRCKNCWHFFYRNYGDSKLYCPNCGADMRGESDG